MGNRNGRSRCAVVHSREVSPPALLHCGQEEGYGKRKSPCRFSQRCAMRMLSQQLRSPSRGARSRPQTSSKHGATAPRPKTRGRMTQWPSYFPDQCPPADARNDNVQVFRLVTGTPLSAEDFLPTIAEQPHRDFDVSKLCAACGVSVYRNVQDAMTTRARFKALRSRKIARGRITESDGVILETFTPSHMTWWLQTSTPHINFSEYHDHESP